MKKMSSRLLAVAPGENVIPEIALQELVKDSEGFYFRKRAMDLMKRVIAAFALITWIALSMGAPVCATRLKEDLCLIRYDENLQPYRPESQGLSHVLTRESECKGLSFSPYEKYSESDLNHVLKKLTKRLRFALSPSSVIKPFILVQKLETILWVYQSKTLRSTIQLDEQFQAKTMPLSNRVTKRLQTLKKAGFNKFFMTPYQNRIYGLHFQLVW